MRSSFEPLCQTFEPLPQSSASAPARSLPSTAEYEFVSSVAEMCAGNANMLETMLADSDKESVPFLNPGHKDHGLFYKLLGEFKHKQGI